MPRRRPLLPLALAALALPPALFGAAWLAAGDTLGASADGARRARMEASPAWRDGAFDNALQRVDGPFVETIRLWFFGGSEHRSPNDALPVQARTRADYATPPPSGLRVTWLGHSTLLLEIDGVRVLIDPVWGERASPFSGLGPARWFAPPLPLAELPDVDLIVVSHDHYDHLDHPTVLALLDRDVRWAVPLGIGAHLERWGVPANRIEELDWWERTKVGSVEVTATPARHFSGRWVDDTNATLWAGWAFVGPTHRAYYSGDTSLFPELREVGDRLGPFDLTMIEVGAYSTLWTDVHLGPEQAVRAHRLVRGNVLLPVHWGLFDLGLHGWTEPMERTLAAAEREGVRVVAPRPGDILEPADAARAPADVERWWPDVPWDTVAETPVYSTGVEALMRGDALPPMSQPATATQPAAEQTPAVVAEP